jgi:hypothetical protein
VRSTRVFGSRPIRRSRAEMAHILQDLYHLLTTDHPMTVRQVFYRLESHRGASEVRIRTRASRDPHGKRSHFMASPALGVPRLNERCEPPVTTSGLCSEISLAECSVIKQGYMVFIGSRAQHTSNCSLVTCAASSKGGTQFGFIGNTPVFETSQSESGLRNFPLRIRTPQLVAPTVVGNRFSVADLGAYLRGNTMSLIEVASRFRLKTVRAQDETIIPGKYGQRYLVGPGKLGCLVMVQSVRRWRAVKGRLLAVGCALMQDGDNEGTLRVDPGDTRQYRRQSRQSRQSASVG